MNHEYRACPTESGKDLEWIRTQLVELDQLSQNRDLQTAKKYVSEQKLENGQQPPAWHTYITDSMTEAMWENMRNMLNTLYRFHSRRIPEIESNEWLDTDAFQFLCMFMGLSCNLWVKVEQIEFWDNRYLLASFEKGNVVYGYATYVDDITKVLQEINVFYSDDHFFIAHETMAISHKIEDEK